MIAAAGWALALVAAVVAVRLELHWRRIDRQRAADRHAFHGITHGQMVSVSCACGQTMTCLTEESARNAWAKHRRQEVT